jgi:hypothetical protein
MGVNEGRQKGTQRRLSAEDLQQRAVRSKAWGVPGLQSGSNADEDIDIRK